MKAEKQYKKTLSQIVQSKQGPKWNFVDNRCQTMVQTKLVDAIQRLSNREQAMLLRTATIQRTPKQYDSLTEIETILNEKESDKWVYVGGYAAYLHAIQGGLPPIPFGDYDIVVLNSENFEELKKLIYGGEDEQPVVDGHDVSILSATNLPPKVKIGNAFVADSDSIAKTYKRNLDMKYLLKGGAEKNQEKFDEKDSIRWLRIQQMNTITATPKVVE